MSTFTRHGTLVATSEWSRVDTCRYPQVHAENGRLLAVFRIVVAVRDLIMSLFLSRSSLTMHGTQMQWNVCEQYLTDVELGFTSYCVLGYI